MPMQPIVSAAALLLAVIGWAVAPTGAVAQPWAGLANPQIEIAYVEPRNANFRPIYERLRQRQVLEELRAFLSPLKLPRKLQVRVDECGGIAAPFSAGGPVVICYEYVEQIERLAPRERRPLGPNWLTRESALVGAFVQIMLHDVAEAVMEILEIPVWGREDDAADRVAAYIMVQFGKDVAWRTIMGTAWFLDAGGAGTISPSDVRSPTTQRFYNYLCIAYGADPKTYEFLIKAELLPERRARRCRVEYAKFAFAFGETMLKYVDMDLLKRVQATEWVKPDDGK
jgi:hypothetical protein